MRIERRIGINKKTASQIRNRIIQVKNFSSQTAVGSTILLRRTSNLAKRLQKVGFGPRRVLVAASPYSSWQLKPKTETTQRQHPPSGAEKFMHKQEIKLQILKIVESWFEFSNNKNSMELAWRVPEAFQLLSRLHIELWRIFRHRL